MLDFKSTLAFFERNQKSKKEEVKEFQNQKEVKKFSNETMEFLKNLNNPNNKQKNEPPLKSNKLTISTNKNNTQTLNKNININKDNKNYNIINIEKPKIIVNSEIENNENPDMVIYKYPKIKINDCKYILFIGHNPEQFVNSFINIYRDICYEDKFRYKIETTDSYDTYRIYNIKARTAKKNLRIITLQSLLRKENFVKNLLKLFNNKENNIKRLNYIYITLKEKKELGKYGIIVLLVLLNLFKNEDLKNKINILFSKEENCSDNTLVDGNQEKNQIKINSEINENIILSEYYNNSSINQLYNPKYFFINNNILFKKNTENEWKILYEQIKKIQTEIEDNKNKSINFDNIDKKKISILNDIFNNNEKRKFQISNAIKNYTKNEQISIINLLLDWNNKNKFISTFILDLYNNIIGNKKEIKISDKEIIFIKDYNLDNSINILSNVIFPDLQYINCKNCDLNDSSLSMISKLFSTNLINLNLSNNKFSDLTIFNDQETLINLKDLNLSYNNIINIESIANCKLLNLTNLDLSHNEIVDISCFENNLYFNHLEKLDLSFNKIKKLNKIDIKTLNYLGLLNNEISEGMLDFNCSIEKLVLSKEENVLSFKYYKKDIIMAKTPFIDFLFLVEKNNMNEILKNISFKGIKILEIYGFNDIEFLINESLNNLKILDIKSNVNDITIFNNIKFIDIDEIKFKYYIYKGFSSLNIFKSIKINKIEVKICDNDYNCNLITEYPKINIIYSFNDLDFLKDPFLLNSKTVIIDEKILKKIFENKNELNFISFNEIINSFPILKNMKAENIDINFNKDKYISKTKFYYHEFEHFGLNFIIDDLKFISDEFFNKIKIIKLSNIRLIDSIGIIKNKFPYLSKFYLEKCVIESINSFSEMVNIKSFTEFKSNSNICKSELFELFDQKELHIHSISSTNTNKISIHYSFPLEFNIEIDKIDKINGFKFCKDIYLNNLQFTDNDLIFLNNETLWNLETLNLDKNKITNLNFLENIKSKKLKKISIRNNLINQGIEIINNKNNLELQNIEVKIKNDDKNKYMISLDYSGTYYLSFDYMSNNNFDIFNEINFHYNSLDLSNLKLKNIDFMAFKNMQNFKSIYLDKNEIEDISIFEKIDFNINIKKISIKQNPIRKGLHVLKNNFFKCLYIDLDIIKTENEYKICSNFMYPSHRNIIMEFYINDINELKDILDIKNTYIKLLKNDTDELKLLEKEFLQNQSYEQKELFEKIILQEFFQKNETINIIRENNHLQIIKDNNIYINDNNKILIEKIFLYLHERLKYFSNININLQKFQHEDEKIIQDLLFIQINNLRLTECNININILKQLDIKSLDLSETNIIDIGINDILELRANHKELILSDNKCIIIDNGTSYIKAGFSGKNDPIAVFHTCVGYSKYDTNDYTKQLLIGLDEFRAVSHGLNYPIEYGIINNWDDIEKIWGNIFTNELRVDPIEHNIILTESPMNIKENREKMAQILFETFKVPGLFIANQVVLSLFSAGKYTGLVEDLGDGATHIVPIFDGYSIPHALFRLDIAGKDLTEYMMKLLNKSYYRFSTTREKMIVKKIKEESCYVALDLEEEIKYVEPFYYELPDGTKVVVKEQRIKCPEALFKPSMIGKEGEGIGFIGYYSIEKCDFDIRKELYNNIVLSGGNSMFKGLPERLFKEIKALAPESMKEEVNVIAFPDRKFATWIGGSILSSSSNFESMLITKSEYEEYGATIVHRKCF